MDLSEVEPVERRSTAAIVADRIREAIMRGMLPPGTQLGEVELATRLGVSRGPLREAMQRLVAEGLLVPEGEKRGRFYVASDFLRTIRRQTHESRKVEDPFAETSNSAAPLLPGMEPFLGPG